MSFGLPLHDRILKWQLVSRVDSVSPVRGKKQLNQRTNISNIFEYSDERVRMALPERRASSSGFPKQFASLGGCQRKRPCLLASIYWAPTRCSDDSKPIVQRRLHPSLLLLSLRLFEVETGGDFIFYWDKESKMLNGIITRNMFSYW